MNPSLKNPFLMIIAGPTNSGKTSFVQMMINNRDKLFYPKIDEIIYCYTEWQPIYNELLKSDNITFIEGLPQTEDFKFDRFRLIILDDLMDKLDERVTRMFTKESHHRGISVVYITQNLFSKNKEHRTISLNTQYIVLFKNPRDQSQVVHLAKQMYPGNVNYMKDAYKKATSDPFGYLFIDLNQETSEEFRLRTNIFSEDSQIVFLPK